MRSEFARKGRKKEATHKRQQQQLPSNKRQMPDGRSLARALFAAVCVRVYDCLCECVWVCSILFLSKFVFDLLFRCLH